MNTATDTGLSPAARGMIVALAFVLTATVVRFTIECCGGGLVAGLLIANDPGLDLTDPTVIPTVATAALTILDLLVLGALAVGFAALLPPLRKTLGVTVGTWSVYPLSVLGGLTVGLSFGWIGEPLRSIVPDWLQINTLDMISHSLLEGPLLGRLLMMFAVSLVAPVFEEVVFRGTLWGALERFLPRPVVWVLTSMAFALFHLDPIHVILVFPVGLMIGWMRLVSRSLFPCIVLHMVNNTLAIVLVLTIDPSWEPPWWGVLIAFTVTMTVFFTALLLRARPVDPVLA